MNIRVTILYSLLILIILLLANFGLLAPITSTLHFIPYSDKIVHFLLIGTLALVVNYAMQCAVWHFGQVPIFKGSVIIAVLVTLEEFSQYFQPNRTFDLADLAANYAGIIVFSLLSWAVHCFQKQKVIKKIS